eukprot:885141-Pelagomonas_calceolata.AAC.2
MTSARQISSLLTLCGRGPGPAPKLLAPRQHQQGRLAQARLALVVREAATAMEADLRRKAAVLTAATTAAVRRG